MKRHWCAQLRSKAGCNLPGSPQAVREGLEVILPAIPPTLAKIQGDPGECSG
jgi:molybdopterin biosynthesis enzyme MoaB